MDDRRSIITVFTNESPGTVGLSVLPDGSNLPKIDEWGKAWRFSKIALFSRAGLRGITVDVEGALSNLKTRGYHIGRTEAVILEFPFGGKASAKR
jgi:hypothetical protein